MLSRADARRGSKVYENILAYLHFKINYVWDELKRKLMQNKMETEKLTFKPEFDGAVTIDRHPLHAHLETFSLKWIPQAGG